MTLRVHRVPRLTDTDASAKRSEIDRRGRAHPGGPGEHWTAHARAGTGGRSERAAGSCCWVAGTYPGKALEETRVRRERAETVSPFISFEGR